MNNHSKLIKLKTIKNIRDLAGIKNKDGLSIKPNCLLRSGTLAHASEDDMLYLYENYNLRTIIDLRSPSEKWEMPDTVIQDMEFVGVLLQKGGVIGVTQDEKSRQKMAEYFKELEEKCKDDDYAKAHMSAFYYSIGFNDDSLEGFKQFFNTLLDNDNCVLWHCSLGRDRCGMATALLLKVLDVDEKSIVEDYLYTNECLNWQEFVSDCYNNSQPEYINAFFKGIEDKYGNTVNYLSILGIESKQINKLKEKYLEHK